MPTMRNEQGLRRDFELLLQSRRPDIETDLRDRFYPLVLQDGEPARANYAQLLGLATLDLNPNWLDELWELPEALFDAHVTHWLDLHAPRPTREPDEPLGTIAELRDTGRRVVASVLANARLLTAAWVRKNGGVAPDLPADSVAIIEPMTREGRLDFERLTAAPVISWIAQHYAWPAGMPQTLTRSQLGLTAPEVEQTRAALEAERQAAQASARSVSFGSESYTDDPDDQRRLAEAIQEQLVDRIFDQDLQAVSLLPAQSNQPRTRSPRTGRAGRATPAHPAVTSSIGLAGEIVVAEWVRQLTGLPREVTWKSGYRSDILGDGEGSDSYGYDFDVPLDGRRLLLEVKASLDDVHEFQLNETEVHRAQALEDHETYLIVAVSYVLDPDRVQITPLPNPLGFAGLSNYEVVGRALRLRYEVSPD